MSPEEQRIAIAEACGIKNIQKGGWVYLGKGESKNCEVSKPIPDYLSDLNAMHEAEKALDSDKRERYMTALAMADPGHGSSSWYIVHLTAAQRAEAFLRTIGKWNE